MNKPPLKVILINPPALKNIEPHYDRPRFPRTALAFLGGYIREHFSQQIEVKLVDCKFDRLTNKDAIRVVNDFKPDVIGFTAMTNEIIPAAKLCQEVKKEYSFTSVIGGVHYTAIAEETLREFPCFDYGIAGEGEEPFLELLECLYHNRPIHIPGVARIEGSKLVGSVQTQRLQDQNSVDPAWDLFRPAKEYIIQSARGCPFACEFCMNPGGRIVRYRTTETTIKEIEKLIETMGPEVINFGDEIFTVNQKRAEEICDELIAHGLNLKMKWKCQTHVNTLNERLIQKMKKSGCYLMGLGIETGDADLIRRMGKGISIEKVKKVIAMIQKHKLDYSTFFILGQAFETKQTAKNTVDFAVELNPMEPVFGLMVPYPGTKVWEMANKNQGGFRILSRNWNTYNKQIGDSLELEGITRKQLERIQFLAYIKVFLYNFRFSDFFRFCLRYWKPGIGLLKKQLVPFRH